MVISVENLVKKYGFVHAVKGISFSVNRGEIFGLLGPNGAGKTTVIETLIGLRKADEGHVVVLGTNINSASTDFRERIGVQLLSMSPSLKQNTLRDRTKSLVLGFLCFFTSVWVLRFYRCIPSCGMVH